MLDAERAVLVTGDDDYLGSHTFDDEWTFEDFESGSSVALVRDDGAAESAFAYPLAGTVAVKGITAAELRLAQTLYRDAVAERKIAAPITKAAFEKQQQRLKEFNRTRGEGEFAAVQSVGRNGKEAVRKYPVDGVVAAHPLYKKYSEARWVAAVS